MAHEFFHEFFFYPSPFFGEMLVYIIKIVNILYLHTNPFLLM
jgi:hypothetical protein